MNARSMIAAAVSAAAVALALVAPAGATGTRPADPAFTAFLGQEDNALEYEDLLRYLDMYGVKDVVPAEHLLRQGTDFARAGEPRYAMPPRQFWPNIVPTLELIRREIVPLVGEVEVVSAYRSYRYNARAGGTEASAHLMFSALDVVPKRRISRKQLHAVLLKAWREIGVDYDWGLGLYSRVRFHVDTKSHRRW